MKDFNMMEISEKMERLAKLQPTERIDAYIEDCGIADKLKKELDYLLETEASKESIIKKNEEVVEYLDYCLRNYGG